MPPHPPSESEDLELELLERWRAGERSALDRLLVEVMPWLHREVSKAMGAALRGAEDSQDIVQTAVLRFLHSGPKFIPANGAQLRALLKRIAQNELIDRRRHLDRTGAKAHIESFLRSSRPSLGFAASTARPSGAAEQGEEIQWVQLAMQFLDEDDRFLLLASVSGADWATIARELELGSADAARVRCARLKPKVANVMRRLRAGWIPEEA